MLHLALSSVAAKRLTGDAPLATKLKGGEAPHRRRSMGHQAQWMRNASRAMPLWPPGSMEAKRLTGDAPLATRLSGGEAPHKRRSTGHQAQWRRSATLATLHWPPSPGAPLEEVTAPRLIERLLPMAQAGLDRAGVDLQDSAHRLETIAARAASGQTGARWQQRALAACTAGAPAPGDFDRVFARYLELSRGDAPVHTWPEFSG